MSRVFLTVLNMSAAAGWVVAVIVLLRLLSAKAPKRMTVWLWAAAAVRLICPFAPQSRFSLLPTAETVSPAVMTADVPQITSGIPILNRAVNPALAADSHPLQTVVPLLAAVWLAGVVLVLLGAAVSYLRLKRRLSTAVLQSKDVYRSEWVDSPFVLGVFRPKIYLPFALTGRDAEMALAHEQMHIRRGDCLWKPLGYLLSALHWFNPLLWLGYTLFCRDLESACDEAVVRGMTAEECADYAQALLLCSASRRKPAVCPLAFGENGAAQRIKRVLNRKKPAFWAVLAAAAAGLIAAVCLLTNPVGGNARAWRMQAIVYCHFAYSYVQAAEDAPQYLLEDDTHLYVCADGAAPVLLGQLEDIPKNDETWDTLFPEPLTAEPEAALLEEIRRGNRRARQLCSTFAGDYGQQLYILLEQTDGSVYLGCGYPAGAHGADSDAFIRILYKTESVRPSTLTAKK